jgi:hypothetical protein
MKRGLKQRGVIKKMLDQATYLRQKYERAKREKEGIKGKLKV